MEKKFCVWITGVDDLIPTHNVREAVRAAAYMNATLVDTLDYPDRVTPACFAVPQVWPHSAQEHEESLRDAIERAKGQNCPHWMIE